MTINNLPKYDAQGNEIRYTVTEQNVPEGYTKISEEGTTVINRADPIAEKTAYKAEQDGTIGSEVVDTDLFKSNEIVYYKLTFKNAGNTTIESKILTDIMPLRINMIEIDEKDVTTGTTSGTDSNGHIWTLTKNERGNTIITWNLINIPAGEIDELTIKAQVVEDAEYKHLCGLYGETTNYTANLYVRKDGKVPYEGSGLSQEAEYYTNSLGTVYLKETNLENNTEANLKNDDLYYIVKNNNTISDMISRSISREDLENELEKNGIILTNEEIVVWYVIKNENSTYRIEGVIRKISEIKSITNVLYMDNVQVEETIILEDVEMEQRGSVSIQGMQSTTSVVSTPMDVVFILDTSGSMGNKLSGQTGTKANSMVNAVNATIKTIMSKNSDSRIGIVGYSNSASVIIPLGTYSYTGNYLTLKTSNGSRYIQSNVGNKSDRTVTGGTNTQAGIKLGAEMLTANNLDRSFTTTAHGVQVTGTRTPVIILVTDGEPTYYYSNESATGTRYGDGNSGNQNYYYWTLRTANYYKEQVRKQYYGTSQEKAKMFTIGIGLDGTLPTTMLKPNQTNVDLCKNSSDKSEAKKLYNLLNSSGTPYAYDYADATATGALTEENIKDFLTTSINSSTTSLIIRAITADEASARRVDLTDIDIAKAFTLEIIDETTMQYNTLNDAITAGYVKQDSTGYYVDLTNVTRGTAVNISYWHVEY